MARHRQVVTASTKILRERWSERESERQFWSLRMAQHHQGEVVEYEGEEYPLRVPYVVHPTVFDFITTKSTEDNFITVIYYPELTVAFREKIRRLSLHFGSATYASTPDSIGLSNVRTLSFLGHLSCMPTLVEFKLVRVLILHVWAEDGNKNFPLAEICRLLLLRYLQVRCNVTVELPGRIGCLKHLETLEINSVVTAIPSDVFHLSRLLHLHLGLKQNFTLGPVAAVNAISSDELLPPKDDSSSTSTPSVQIFELLLPICIFSRLPKWIPQLRKLSILEIVVRQLLASDIDMLADLPLLTALSLYVRIPTTGNIVFHRGTFPALKYFRFMCGVLSLDFQEEAVPNLQRLTIEFNVRKTRKYDNILAGIQHLLNLQEVVASIGATQGTEENDRIAAESELKDAINQHRRPTKFIMKRVHQVEEEYPPPPLDPLSLNEQEVIVIHGQQTEVSTNEQSINHDKVPTKDTHEHPNFGGIRVRKNISVISRAGNAGNSRHRETNDMPVVILDNQAGVHCTGNFNVLSSLNIGRENVVLVAANGGEMETIMSGSVNKANFELTDVYYCPDLGNRIIVSRSILGNDDYGCEFGRGKITVKDLRNGTTIGEGRLVGGYYILDYLKIPGDRTRVPGLVTTVLNAISSALHRLGLNPKGPPPM